MAFRERYNLTQAEVARAVGARDHSGVSQWESGDNVPDGMLRQRLADLLDGRRWLELRAAALDVSGDRLPERWDRAARWYRRASRERGSRTTAGVAVAAILDELRGTASVATLRQHYGERDGDWVRGVAVRCGLDDESPARLRRLEDAGYGLRWLELAHDLHLDLVRSLAPQLPRAVLGGTPPRGELGEPRCGRERGRHPGGSGHGAAVPRQGGRE